MVLSIFAKKFYPQNFAPATRTCMINTEIFKKSFRSAILGFLYIFKVSKGSFADRTCGL